MHPFLIQNVQITGHVAQQTTLVRKEKEIVIMIMNVWVILSVEQIIVLVLTTHLMEIVVKNLPQPLQQQQHLQQQPLQQPLPPPQPQQPPPQQQL